MAVRLFQSQTSMFCEKIRIVPAMKGVPYEIIDASKDFSESRLGRYLLNNFTEWDRLLNGDAIITGPPAQFLTSKRPYLKKELPIIACQIFDP